MTTGSIITLKGKQLVLNRSFKGTPDYTAPFYYSLGTGTTTPAVSDIAIEHSIPFSKSVIVDNCDVITGWSGNADATISLNSITYKEGVASIDLSKTGTASVNCSMSKTTTSGNFTNRQLDFWIYIKDATAYAKLTASNCLEIRFGSDGSNYYKWNKNASDLAVGWNWLHDLSTSNATIQGTPMITACDYTLIQYTTNNASDTTSAGDVIIDDIYLTDTDDYYNVFVTGYPDLNEANLQVSFRMYINTAEANGFSLTEFGLSNSDTSKKLFSRVVFTPITKNNSVQIFFLEKDMIE